MFQIGPYRIDGKVILAPMAGVTDLPQRELCSRFGAAYTVSEMVTSDTALWDSRKTRSRLQWGNTSGPRVIQIAGSEPGPMAQAAREAVAAGAQVVDINMGCPAKKVCAKAAGSALLRDEPLVASILKAVTCAVDVPVTLKIRTGWDEHSKNAVTIAQMAEAASIAALTIHGRTRACRFKGEAEYRTIAEVAGEVSIPVIANGDITSPQKARQVLVETGAAAVMIGRAALGNPWLFGAIKAYLQEGALVAPPTLEEVGSIVAEHVAHLHRFYGDYSGVRIARKHLSWYLGQHTASQFAPQTEVLRQQFNTLTKPEEQLAAVRRFFERLLQLEDQAA